MFLELARTPLDPDTIVRLSKTAPPDVLRERLGRICASAEGDVAMTEVGRLGLLDRLVNALRTHAALAQRPDSPALARPPVVVLGMPRSGTTLMHHLLDSHPELRALRSWEVVYPLKLDGEHRARRRTEDRIRRLTRLAPDLVRSHRLDVDFPEECLPLLEPSLATVSLAHSFPIYSYVESLGDEEVRGAYAIYGRLVRHLAAETPDQRLVLKGPAHGIAVDALLEQLPGAQVVWTHRAPSAVQASLAVLCERFHAPMCVRTDPARSRALHVDWMVRTIGHALRSDAVHVRFDALVQDPVGVAMQVLAALGLAPAPLGTAMAPRDPAEHPAETFEPAVQAAVDRYRERFL